MPSDENLAERLAALEAWRVALEIANARAEEQRKFMAERFDGLDKKITDIGGTITWINRLVIGAIVLAVMAFLVKGGFTIPS